MKDYLTDDATNDLVIKNGDFVLGDTTKQNQKRLLVSNKGAFREFPLICVGLINYLDDEDYNDLIREVRREMVKDGMTVDELAITADGSIRLNATYK